MKTSLNQKGFTAFELVIVVVALAAIGAAGYFAYEARQDKTDYSVPAPKKSAEKPKVDDKYEGWKTYTSSFNKVSFKYPANWQVSTQPADLPNEGQVKVKLASPSGFVMHYSEWVNGLGGGCEKSTPNIVITKTQELKGAPGLYLVENPGTIALSSSISKTGDTGTCLVYPFIDQNKQLMFSSSTQFLPNTTKFPANQEKDVEEGRLILLSFTK